MLALRATANGPVGLPPFTATSRTNVMTTLDVEPFYTRTLCHGQRTEVWIAAALGGHPGLIYTDDRLLLDACPFDDGTQP
jgi:hypothetical protein